MMIHAAAHSDAFKAIVSEGGSGQSFRDAYANSGLVDAIAGNLPVTLATALFTNTLPPPSLESQVPKISRTRSSSSTASRVRADRRRCRTRAFYAAASEPKQIWEVPDRAAHRRHHDRARRVRAARDRLLRPEPAPGAPRGLTQNRARRTTARVTQLSWSRAARELALRLATRRYAAPTTAISVSTITAAQTWYAGAPGGASDARGQAMLTLSKPSQATARALTTTPARPSRTRPAGIHVPRARAIRAASAMSRKAT